MDQDNNFNLEQWNTANTFDQMGHHFGSVAGYKLKRQMGLAPNCPPTEYQRKFVDGLERLLRETREGKVIVQREIGLEQINRVIEAAKRLDWSTAEGLRGLYHIYGVETGSPFTPEFLSKIV